jgi:hypothetical protein
MSRVARRRILSVVLPGVSVALVAAAVFADPARITQVAGPKVVAAGASFEQLLERQGALVQRLSPEMQRRLDAAGRDVFTRLSQPTPPGAKPKTMLDAARDVAKDSSANLGSLTNGDVEALTLIVMMEADKSAEPWIG